MLEFRGYPPERTTPGRPARLKSSPHPRRFFQAGTAWFSSEKKYQQPIAAAQARLYPTRHLRSSARKCGFLTG